MQLGRQFFRRRLAADFVQHLARRADQLVDGLDHVHRNTDGARLIGNRAGDGLADPPGGVGREFVAAAVFELIDRLHQADIAFLDQVQELQATVGVFFGNRDHEPKVGLDHFLFALWQPRVRLFARSDDAAEFRISAGRRRRKPQRSAARIFDLVTITLAKRCPVFGGNCGATVSHRIKFAAAVLFKEVIAFDRDEVAMRKQLSFKPNQTPIEAVQ